MKDVFFPPWSSQKVIQFQLAGLAKSNNLVNFKTSLFVSEALHTVTMKAIMPRILCYKNVAEK